MGNVSKLEKEHSTPENITKRVSKHILYILIEPVLWIRIRKDLKLFADPELGLNLYKIIRIIAIRIRSRIRSRIRIQSSEKNGIPIRIKTKIVSDQQYL
jgi:hypothetical protein